jgi:hypothetical protein
MRLLRKINAIILKAGELVRPRRVPMHRDLNKAGTSFHLLKSLLIRLGNWILIVPVICPVGYHKRLILVLFTKTTNEPTRLGHAEPHFSP